MGLVQKPAWRGKYLPFGWDNMTVAPVRMRNGKVVPAGLGEVTPCSTWLDTLLNSDCWSNSTITPLPPVLPPPAPSGSVLTTAPASGQTAQATVDTLISQNAAQNAANVQDFFTAIGTPDTSGAPNPPSGSGIPFWVWLVGGAVGMIALLRVAR